MGLQSCKTSPGRGVSISSFLQPSQVGKVRLSVSCKGTHSQAEGQGPLRQAIMYDDNNKSNEKQVKETVPSWSQN